jgi:hypothetical protein
MTEIEVNKLVKAVGVLYEYDILDLKAKEHLELVITIKNRVYPIGYKEVVTFKSTNELLCKLKLLFGM